MQKLLNTLEEFFKENAPVYILNTSTDSVLLCLNPEFEIDDGLIFMRFESLNERGGNSVYFKTLQGKKEKTLYLENEDENILKLQAIDLTNYKQYIQPNYVGAPDFSDLGELKKFIKSQNE